MSRIYHITTRREWEQALSKGAFVAGTLATEGFIHASEAHQVAGVLERYFTGQSGLVKLVIDPALLKSQLIYEWSPVSRDTFPHIYGPINLEAVIGAEYLIH